MTSNHGMPDNPGDPENTDPEATSADRAESAAQEAEASQAEAEADQEPALDAEGGEAEAEDSIEKQLAERTEDLQRLNAEYTNYRRRAERERQAIANNAKAQVISQFLPVLDDLELARQHGDLDSGPLKSVSDKIGEVFKGQKVEAFGEEGDAFDPEIHEAVQDLSSGDEQVLGTVLRRGYRVGDVLIRNAMVIIADPGSAEAEQE